MYLPSYPHCVLEVPKKIQPPSLTPSSATCSYDIDKKLKAPCLLLKILNKIDFTVDSQENRFEKCRLAKNPFLEV